MSMPNVGGHISSALVIDRSNISSIRMGAVMPGIIPVLPPPPTPGQQPTLNYLAATLPSSFDLSTLAGWPAVIDQGSYGTCVSTSIAIVLEWLLKRPISAMYIHFNAQGWLAGVPVYELLKKTDGIDTVSRFVVPVDGTNNIRKETYGSGAPSTISVQQQAFKSSNSVYFLNGLSIVNALSALDAFGLVDEALVPYMPVLFPPEIRGVVDSGVAPFAAATVPSPADYAEGAKRANDFPYTALDDLYSDNDLVQAIKYCIAVKRMPLIIGYQVSWQQYFQALTSTDSTKRGFFGKPGRGDYNLGGHCSLLCGFDDSVSSFLLMNTWGTRQGDDSMGLRQKPGYFYISYDYIKDPSWCSDVWALIPSSEFVIQSTPLPTRPPAFIPGSVASPLIVGLNVAGLFDVIDLSQVFTNSSDATFKCTATSTVSNVSVYNSYGMIVYTPQPYRRDTYQVTIVATNAAGSCTTTIDVHEGPMTGDTQVLLQTTSALADEYARNASLLEAVKRLESEYKRVVVHPPPPCPPPHHHHHHHDHHVDLLVDAFEKMKTSRTPPTHAHRQQHKRK